VEAEEVFLCFYLFILIFLSRFYLTFLSLFEFPGRELFDCNPELRLARIAPRPNCASGVRCPFRCAQEDQF